MKIIPSEVVSRDVVFVTGGEPSFTYVRRSRLGVETTLLRAIHAPNQMVSLSGPSKSGKTVLCRKILPGRECVWIEGGTVGSAQEVWEKICYELNRPIEISRSKKQEWRFLLGLKALFNAEGSETLASENRQTYKIDTMATAIRYLTERDIALVIDDFHFLPEEARRTFLRNCKGAVFRGLKIILLSVAHRGSDAIRAESELQGRVCSINLPFWDIRDLEQIASLGFRELNITCDEGLIGELAHQAQGSPLLMQRLCWEVCEALNVNERLEKRLDIGRELIARDFYPALCQKWGHPTYERITKEIQLYRDRRRWNLVDGGAVDIFELLLISLASAGPVPRLSLQDLRVLMNEIAMDEPPDVIETVKAIEGLVIVSQEPDADSSVDWDAPNRTVIINDPFFRFYLRWRVTPAAERLRLLKFEQQVDPTNPGNLG